MDNVEIRSQHVDSIDRIVMHVTANEFRPSSLGPRTRFSSVPMLTSKAFDT